MVYITDDRTNGGGITTYRDTVKKAVAPYRRLWWVVALAALVGGIASLALSLAQVEKYSATATLYVTASSQADAAGAAYQGSLASQQRVASYARLVTSEAVLREALSESGLGMTVSDASRSLSARTTSETVLLEVTGSASSPVDAAVLANAVATALTKYVTVLETPSSGGLPLAKLTVVSPAVEDATPVSPRPKRNVAVGLVAGAFVGLFVVYVRSRLDAKIRDASDVEDVVGGPTLSSIPEDPDLRDRRLLRFDQGFGAATEAYRMLRTNLTFADVDDPAKILLVTSGLAGEGKTTTALNLAASLAETGSTVCLVDADLRLPRVGSLLGLNEAVGLTNVLRGELDLAASVQHIGVVGLDVLVSGSRAPNPAELLGSKRTGALIAEMGHRYDYVVIDSPPALPVADASILAQYVDGTLFVVRAGRSRKPETADAVSRLEGTKSSLLGVVLNGVPAEGSYYGGYSGYGKTSVESSAGTPQT